MGCYMFWQTCPQCASHHWFVLPGSECTSRCRTYEFICPRLGADGRIRPEVESEEVDFIPPGAVIVARHQDEARSCASWVEAPALVGSC